jgi:hypothetical protein
LDCNEQKSSGMDVDDVQYVCDKVGYKKTDALLSMINSSTLTADEIRLVSKQLFNKQ